MRLFRVFLLALWLPAGAIAQSGSEEDNFYISDYRLNITFQPEGDAVFEEIIEVQFLRQRHGIFRYIPLRSRIDGKNVDRIIRDIRIEGFPFSSSKENQNLVLKIGDADKYVEGRQVYKINFRVVNPVDFFKDHAQFYWDIVGISWPVRIEAFSFNLFFPKLLTPADDEVLFYSGASGATSHHVAFQILPGRIEGHVTQPLAPREAVTVAVKLPRDLFPPPGKWEVLRAKYGYFLAAILFVLGGVLARVISRNRRQTIMTEYFPPEGISPAIAGGFVDHSVDNNDVLSLIPHLANKGYLRMEVTEGKGFFKKDSITFYKLKDGGPELYNFEMQFFNALFSTGDMVPLKSLKDRFYTHMASVKTSVKEWIKKQGWYEADQKAFGCVIALMGLASAGWGAFVVFGKGNMAGIALIVAGVLLFYFASRFNKRSPLGNETYRKLEGFRQFVKKAERPVIERLLKDDPLYYDKTMPFALAFGYLRQWNRQFDGLLTQPPSWYGGHAMTTSDLHRSWSTFSTSFPSEINSVGSVFSSSPSGSSSGGGGGGGFSGGGSGGGGGGSW